MWFVCYIRTTVRCTVSRSKPVFLLGREVLCQGTDNFILSSHWKVVYVQGAEYGFDILWSFRAFGTDLADTSGSRASMWGRQLWKKLAIAAIGAKIIFCVWEVQIAK